jgi:hypothetical protein
MTGLALKLAAAAALSGLLSPGIAVAGEPQATLRQAATSELSAQGRPRLRVTPGGRQLYRDCNFKLVQEFRPSGTVVVPRMRCWWVRG